MNGDRDVAAGIRMSLGVDGAFGEYFCFALSLA